MISFTQLRRIVFGTSCVVVFGFGASQALASPARAAFYGCDVWEQEQCDSFCSIYGPGVKGRCTDLGLYDCQCVNVAPMPDPYT